MLWWTRKKNFKIYWVHFCHYIHNQLMKALLWSTVQYYFSIPWNIVNALQSCPNFKAFDFSFEAGNKNVRQVTKNLMLYIFIWIPNSFFSPFYSCRVFFCDLFFFSVAFKQHFIASSYCPCHILCCMPLPNWTPPITAVHWTHYVDFARLSLYSWSCFTSVRK